MSLRARKCLCGGGIEKVIRRSDQRPEDLLASSTVAWIRFDQHRELEGQVGNLHRALQQRRVIERGKGVLVAPGAPTAQEVFARQRGAAQHHRVRTTDIAAEIPGAAGRLLRSKE